ncbi:T9SS type A sorting domain-containing protein [Adhaeribacter soli]|nr:T9SS type A sorting domain-containing protein [Adhaeribacter soli]
MTRDFADWRTGKESNHISRLDTAGNILDSKTINARTFDPLTRSFGIYGITLDDENNQYITGGVLGTIRLGSLTINGLLQGPMTPSNGPTRVSGYIAKILNHFNTVSGNLFIDANGNGVKDTGEKPYQEGIIEINPMMAYAVSDSNGNYLAYLPKGNFNLTPSASILNYTISPQNHSVSFTGTNQTQVKDFGFAPIPNRNDVKITVTAMTPSRPGFPLKYRVTYKNVGTTTLSDSLNLKYDQANLTLGSVSVTPAVHQGNYLRWNYQNLQPNESRNIDLQFTVNVSTPRSTVLIAPSYISPFATDHFKANNTDTLRHPVTGSYDPNDKQVNLDKLSPTQVNSGQLLGYVIRFQNTGNDTAFTVVVRDSIGDKLQISSFEMLSASHAYTFRILDKGIIEWRFENILLPDSNRNEPASHGFIRYRIKPKSNLKLGDEIKGRAAIYFDFNEPIFTNFALTRIAEPNRNPFVSDFYLYPNPAKNYVTVAADLKNRSSATISLMNILGQTISKVTLPGNEQLHYKLPLNNLPKGVYVVQLETGNGRRTQRLVIQ